MNFLKTFGAWSLFACSPPLMLALVAAPSKTVDVGAGVLFSLPFLLIPAVGSILLWLPSLRLDTTRKALLAGISFGLFAPFLLGFVYMEIYPGFENRVGIFAGALSPLDLAPRAEEWLDGYDLRLSESEGRPPCAQCEMGNMLIMEKDWFPRVRLYRCD
jgi:hypothetical protein